MPTEPRKVITPQQLEMGWEEFRPNEIPNIIHHQFSNPVKLADGNYEVDTPEVTDAD